MIIEIDCPDIRTVCEREGEREKKMKGKNRASILPRCERKDKRRDSVTVEMRYRAAASRSLFLSIMIPKRIIRSFVNRLDMSGEYRILKTIAVADTATTMGERFRVV